MLKGLDFRKVFLCLILITLSISASVFANGDQEGTGISSDKPIVLSYATNRPPNDPQSVIWLTPMLDEITKRTEGRVEFKVYWSSALGKSSDQYNLIRDGIADVTDFATPYVPGKFLLADVANLPFAAQDPRNLMKAMYTLTEEGYFDDMWDEVEWLGFHSTPLYRFMFRTSKPMNVKELKGLKARAPGGLATKWEESIGMVPVNIAISDAYTSWQTGLVDVWVHPASSVIKYKFYELECEALLDVGFYAMANGANAMNKAKFNSLPEDIQETIKEVFHEYAFIYMQSGLDQDIEAYNVLAENDIEVYNWKESDLDDLKATAAPIWKSYIKDLNSKGYVGDKLVNRFIEILESLGEKPPKLN